VERVDVALGKLGGQIVQVVAKTLVAVGGLGDESACQLDP